MRIFFDCVLAFLILFAPWYAASFVAVLLLFFYERYYEVLFAGLAMDVLYNGTTSFSSFQYLMSFSFAALFILTAFLRTRLKFYGS